MVHYSCRGGHSDRYVHAPGTAQAMVSEKADIHSGSHGVVKRSFADHLHLSPLSYCTCIAIGDSRLPGFGTPGIGRDIPGHHFRSECRRVDRLPGKGMKMAKPLQWLLLAVGVILLLVVG